MFEAAFVFAVLAILAIAHIHLQFMRTDISLQHSELQKQHRTLLREEQKRLLSYEALCDSERLMAVARAADLREVDVKMQKVAMVPEQLREKYAMPAATELYPRPVLATHPMSPEGIAGKLLSLLESGSAFADTLPEI